MKKTISGMLAIVILAFQFVFVTPWLPIQSNAAVDLQCGENAVWNLDGKGVLTISGSGAVYCYKKDDLGEPPWYAYASAVTDVVVNEGITAISARMLTCLSKLRSLTLPASLEAIVDGEASSPAWGYLPQKLTTITVAQGSRLRWCPNYTLEGTQWYQNLPSHQPVYIGNLLYCIKDDFSADTELVIRDGTLALGQYALGRLPDATHITNVSFPDSLQYIGSNGVQNTGWYAAQPDGPVYAGHVFVGYQGGLPLSESEFALADGTIGIADGAFLADKNLTAITLPASLRTIGNSAFASCVNLTTVQLRESAMLTDIGKYAFQNCSQLTAIALPDALEVIGDAAFPPTVTELYFGRNLREIGVNIGSGLQSIRLSAENPCFSQDAAGVIYSADQRVLVLSPAAHADSGYEIADGCTQIRKYAFSGSALSAVTFPASLTWIRSYAFAGADLLSVSFPASLQSIGSYAFYNCTNLQLIDFSTAPVDVGNQAFRKAGAEYIRIPDTVVSLGSGAFADMPALAGARVPGGVLIEHGYCFPSTTRIYCYEGTWIAEQCQTNNYPFTLISQGNVSTDEIYAIFLQVLMLDRTAYENEDLAALDEAYRSAQIATLQSDQATIDAAANQLNAALQALRTKPKPYAVGDLVSFGSYPQTRVEDAALIAQLNALQHDWQSYHYVSGDGSFGSMQAADYMEYCDVSLQGAKYRGVVLHRYRPFSTIESTATDDHEQRYPNADGGFTFYSLDTVYWFRYSPILWRVLDAEKNLMITDAILDAQPYQAFVYNWPAGYYADAAGKYAANDYANTTVRQWLNDTFYNTAFSAAQQERIKPTQIPGIYGRSAVTDPVILLGSNSGDPLAFYNFRQTGVSYTRADRVSDYAGIQGSDYETGGSLVRGVPSSSDTLHTSFMIRNTTWENELPVHNVVSIRPVICLTAPLQADTSALDQFLSAAASADRSLYTDETLQALDVALQAALSAAESTDQAAIDTAAQALQSALNGLQYKPADYSALHDAQAQAASIDRSLYTAESLQSLDAALALAVEDLDITAQGQIDACAAAVLSAIESMVYLPADFSAVDAAIAQANALDLTLYSDLTASAVRSAVAAVDRSLNCTQQAQADAFAAAILSAIEQLEYASVVLRHDATGVIVAGTTRELDLSMVLTVDLVDPSNHEGANYAVGGKIKSLTFYDINLLLKGQRVQPRDIVTVRIRLADGVDPAKCKVYHVTDDLVNPLVRFTSTIDGNYIVFETDHFSEFAVIEVEVVADTISIAQLPAKTVYALGELFDPSGLRVTVHYSDGSDADASDFDISAVSTDTLGTRAVTAYYTANEKTLAARFFITVVSPGNTCHLVLRQPSVTALRYGETLMLYTVGDLPRGASIKWVYDGKGLKLTPTEDTKCCAVYSNGTGEGNVTAYVVDAAGNTLTDANGKPISAAVKLTSNGSFIQRVISFFKNLFHVDRRIDY